MKCTAISTPSGITEGFHWWDTKSKAAQLVESDQQPTANHLQILFQQLPHVSPLWYFLGSYMSPSKAGDIAT